MKKVLLLTTILFVLFSACKEKKETDMQNSNPLLNEFTAKYGIPPFEDIKNEHFLPAFKEAMKQQMDNINLIVSSTEEPTFENTILAFEYSGELYDKVSSVFYNILGSNTSEELQNIAQELVALETQHSSDITFNAKLFEKIKKVYDKKETLSLNSEQIVLLDEIYKDFVRSGANLPKEQQEKLHKINEELSSLTLTFDNNNLAEVNEFQLIIDNKEDLSGLPQSVVDAAAAEAKENNMEGKWLFTLHKPVLIPFLQYADNRDLREKIFKAYINLGNNNNEYDNKELVNKIINLRIEKAQLLGFDNYAQYIVDDNMAKTPEKIYEFLNSLLEKAIPIAQKEAKDLQAMIKKDGKSFKLEPWDWWYYTEKIRKERFEIDEEKVREYFVLENVVQGLFDVVKKLYNLQIKQISDVPLYHQDAVAYEVTDVTSGELIGIFYMDFYPRASKQSGAWMDSYREQFMKDGKDYRPIITTVCNFTKPSGSKPALLSLEEVSTLFHEFGHALHGLLSKCTYPSISGTNVSRDFVELPSQIMENWASEPEVIKSFAKHYQTGEVIPDELLNKIQAAGKFNQGFETVEYLSACILDLDYHTLNEKQNINTTEFENNVMKKINMPKEIVVRYRTTYFGHIFAGGYSAGYYGYIWAAVLDADAFEAFKETGNIFDQTVATAFRKNILEKGGTEDPMQLYVKFRGREPKVEPLLKRRGLI